MNSSLPFFIFISLAFAGCTTPYELKKSKPKISYITERPAQEVMECVLKKWKEHHTTVFEEKTSNGWLVRYNDVLPAATVAIVTIEGMEPEVAVKYYHRTNRLKLHRLEEDVLDCGKK